MIDRQVYDNPYDPATQDFGAQTPSQDVVIREAIRQALLDGFFFRPARVTKVLGNQRVNIQVLLKRRYTDGSLKELPEVQNVMVQMPQGADWSIKVPVAVGDTGSAMFCDRSLDVWANSDGGSVDPGDVRSHALTDAVFVPGLVPFSKQTKDSTTDLVVTNGKAQLKVQKAGTFQLSNGQNELIDLVDQLLDTLINNTFTLTMLGPEPFIASTLLALQQVKTKLDTLKGS